MTSFGKRMLKRMAAVGRSLVRPIGDGLRLPQAVKATLGSQFRLPQNALARLGCVGRKGSYGREHVGLLRIFDRVAAHEQGLKIKSYGELDGRPHLVHFVGKKFNDGALALFPIGSPLASIPSRA
jgi:hypothetical protein